MTLFQKLGITSSVLFVDSVLSGFALICLIEGLQESQIQPRFFALLLAGIMLFFVLLDELNTKWWRVWQKL